VEPLDPMLNRAAAAYHEPPASVPRDAMWAAIQAARGRPHLEVERPTSPATRRETARDRMVRSWWYRAPVRAIAAVLILGAGISIGWFMHDRAGRPNVSPLPPVVATVPASDAAYRIAVVRDLTQAEALLTAFHSDDSRAGTSDADQQVAMWARQILSDTRLLLDSPAAADPARRQLLEDLELVLVQLTPNSADPTDRAMIDRTIARGHILTRLRAAVPAGPTGI